MANYGKRMIPEYILKDLENGKYQKKLEAGDNIIINGNTIDIKPLYCHSILLAATNTKNRIQFLLFNKNNSPFTTLASVKDELLRLAKEADTNTYLMVSGIYSGSQALYVVINPTAETFSMVYKDDNETTGVNSITVNLTSLYSSIYDGITKLY